MDEIDTLAQNKLFQSRKYTKWVLICFKAVRQHEGTAPTLRYYILHNYYCKKENPTGFLVSLQSKQVLV